MSLSATQLASGAESRRVNMDLPAETIIAALVPMVGWALYVEKRLASIEAVEKKVDEVSTDVKALVLHLIGKKDETDDQTRR